MALVGAAAAFVIAVVTVVTWSFTNMSTASSLSANKVVLTQTLSCGAFKERLLTALKLYEIGPPAYNETEAASWDIEGLGDVEATLRCSKVGQFVRFEVVSRVSWSEKDNTLSSLRTGIVMGAALRAYTDWPWKRALEMRDQMVKEANAQRLTNGGLARVDADLTGANAILGIVGGPLFTIESTESPSQ